MSIMSIGKSVERQIIGRSQKICTVMAYFLDPIKYIFARQKIDIFGWASFLRSVYAEIPENLYAIYFMEVLQINLN